MAFAGGKDVGEEHSQRRNPDLEARRSASHAFALEGADDAISARIAEERNRVLGRELEEE